MKKTFIATSLIFFAMFLGDKINILDKTVNHLYYNQEISEKTYQDPFKLHKEYRINDEGKLEVYFGDNQLYLVDENLRVNPPTLKDYIKETGSDLIDKFEQKFFK